MGWIGLAAGTFPDASEAVRVAEGRAELRIVEVSGPETMAALGGCDALVVGLHELTDQHFAALPGSVRVIGRAGVGLNSINLTAADEHAVTVVYQPDYATDEVASHAVALIFALSRRLVHADRIARSAWPSWAEFESMRPLSESRVAVIGLGSIGRTVATRLLPLAREVVGFDPIVTVEGIRRAATLTEALTGSDVVTLHVPFNARTTAMIDESAIELMAEGALLVNVARGGLIDESAVAAALRSGRLGGAGLDVLAAEPPPLDDPLLSTPNTVLTPHMAWLSASSRIRLQQWSFESVLSILDGTDIEHGRIARA